MSANSIDRLKFVNFTAFRELDLKFSPGVNVLIGRNSTGKTHILKALYSAVKARRESGFAFGEKLSRVFAPAELRLGRLVTRQRGRAKGFVRVEAGGRHIEAELTTQMEQGSSARVSAAEGWYENPLGAAYIPVKEMLAHAPGFRSLYATRAIAFEEVYADLVDLAYLPILRGPRDAARKRLCGLIEEQIDGRVVVEGETFYLKDPQGQLEFTLLAEGLRKLALLWLLIQNGTLNDGHILFWDEPESNLNPALQGAVVKVLLELQRSGVQVFIATHHYVLLKEFDLLSKTDDKIAYHALERNERTGSIEAATSSSFADLAENPIQATNLELLDREIARALSGVAE